MKTKDERTQGIIALRKYVRRQLVQTTGIDPNPEILGDNGGMKLTQDDTKQQKNERSI